MSSLDLPGFGESDKPIGAPYNAAWFARVAVEALDALGVERAHLVGNSMGGRVAIEAGLTQRDRVYRLALLSPALAWLRDRRWLRLVRLVRPELGLLKSHPGRSSRRWSAACFPAPWTTGWRWGWTSSCAPT